jgi:hypothetical protein
VVPFEFIDVMPQLQREDEWLIEWVMASMCPRPGVIDTEQMRRVATRQVRGRGVHGDLGGTARDAPSELLTPSRPETESAGNERGRTGTRRNESAGHLPKALIGRQVRFPAAPQRKYWSGRTSLGQFSFTVNMLG